MTFLDRVHPEWKEVLAPLEPNIHRIEKALNNADFLPPPHQVMRAFEFPLSQVRVVIFGQDPYPTPGHANGLAFSVSPAVKPIPKTLRNIFVELTNDTGCAFPKNGDLTHWAEQGVALINRVLTVPTGKSNGHRNIGWEAVTNEVARQLGRRNVVAILWGNNARELSPNIREGWHITSAHPSPLSAHRGFFGSKPFTRANEILTANQRDVIYW